MFSAFVQLLFTRSPCSRRGRETAPEDRVTCPHKQKDIVVEQDGRANNICICGPDGSPLTLADLPSPTTRRWVPSRKAQVVVAVEGGLLSFREACQRYNLTLEEFQHWEVELHLHGLSGLKMRGGKQARNPRTL